MSRKEEFTLTQAEDVVKLSYGVQVHFLGFLLLSPAVNGSDICLH